MKYQDLHDKATQWIKHWLGQLKLRPWRKFSSKGAKSPSFQQWLSMDLTQIKARILRADGQRNSLKLEVNDITRWPQWFRWSLLATLFGLTFAVFAEHWWTSAFNNLNVITQESALLKVRYLKASLESELLEDRLLHIETIENRFGEMLEMIPAELEMVHVLDQISKVARESGMQMETFSPEPELKEQSYAVLPVGVRLSGSFDAAGRFLEGVSRLTHLVTMDLSLEISESSPSKLNLIATLKAYRGDSTKHKDITTNPQNIVDEAR